MTSSESDTAVLASYLLSEILVNRMKPFIDGEIIKQCLEVVAFCGRRQTISKLVYHDSRLEEESSNSRAILTEVGR
jgi:hypothetical protein